MPRRDINVITSIRTYRQGNRHLWGSTTGKELGKTSAQYYNIMGKEFGMHARALRARNLIWISISYGQGIPLVSVYSRALRARNSYWCSGSRVRSRTEFLACTSCSAQRFIIHCFVEFLARGALASNPGSLSKVSLGSKLVMLIKWLKFLARGAISKSKKLEKAHNMPLLACGMNKELNSFLIPHAKSGIIIPCSYHMPRVAYYGLSPAFYSQESLDLSNKESLSITHTTHPSGHGMHALTIIYALTSSWCRKAHVPTIAT